MSIITIKSTKGYCAWLPHTGECFWHDTRMGALHKALRYIFAKVKHYGNQYDNLK